jgi:acid phosphatase family membrane protein YuiD
VFTELFQNHALIAGLSAWGLAQFLKVPVFFILTRRLNFAWMFSSGGMPSSHSALMTATTTAIGLHHGFDQPAFALAFALSMIVTYDAAGVRRQAGIHAEKINLLINEVFSGHPISEARLKEVLGHTLRQVVVGSLLGIAVAILEWAFLR